jgi:hypothetical protein
MLLEYFEPLILKINVLVCYILREGLQRKSFVEQSGAKIVAECPTEFNEKLPSNLKCSKRGHAQKNYNQRCIY